MIAYIYTQRDVTSDVRTVCLFAFAPHSRTVSPNTCSVLNVHSFGDWPARYSLSVSHSTETR